MTEKKGLLAAMKIVGADDEIMICLLYTSHQELPENNDDEGFDFTHVNSVARIALYDNLLSAPRVTEIQPAPTGEFIESLATNVYQQSQAAGGTIPYTVIREVSENFIHARFQEATVSILDHGCTIRFACLLYTSRCV